jgi:hypothetical protein
MTQQYAICECAPLTPPLTLFNGEWKLIHQHASVPSGGDWDGKVITA